MSWLNLFVFMTLTQFFRYFFIAGIAYLIFWAWKNPYTGKNRFQQQDFTKKDLLREFLYSLQTNIVFGVVLTIAFYKLFDSEGKKIPLSAETTIWYDLFSFLFIIIVHDTYFYWMHRWVHKPKIFRHVHQIHHLSKNPSPFAAYSFNFSEAVLESVWIIPMVYFIPIQTYIWIIFGFFMLAINVMGHLGVEIYPESWKSHTIFKWLNFSKYHNDHHKYVHGNYGLYFSFWDRIMGTLRVDQKL